ncbi:MAG: hypothetical protein HY716_03720 [Planctomycetes bacterium]|nr:hypothetical protein [Planctomycetota bacterium]
MGPDSACRDLIRYTRRARRRLMMVRGLRRMLQVFFYALCAVFVWILVGKLLAFPLPAAETALALLGIVILGGIAGALLPRMGLLEAAGAADASAGWKERLSSALALPTVSHSMEHALIEDVRIRLAESAPSRLFPLRAPREFKFAPLVAAAVVAATLWMPALDLLGIRERAEKEGQEKKEMAVAIEKLEQKKKDLSKSDRPLEKVKQAISKIDELAKDLKQDPPLPKKEALAKISNAADELRKMKEGLNKSEALAEKLRKAALKAGGEAGELGAKIRQGRFREAAHELAKMRNALQEGKLSQAEKEKLRKQIEALKKRLGEGKDLSEFEKALAKAMQGLAQGDESMMDDLQQAMSGLDGDLVENEALAEALKDLEGLADALAKDQHRCPS